MSLKGEKNDKYFKANLFCEVVFKNFMCTLNEYPFSMITIVQPRALIISTAAFIPNPAVTIPFVFPKRSFVIAAVSVPIAPESVLSSFRPITAVHFTYSTVFRNFTQNTIAMSTILEPVTFVHPAEAARKNVSYVTANEISELECMSILRYKK